MSQVIKYLGNISEEDVSWGLIQAALSSVAQTTIIPMQDILGLGSSARMNIPATVVNDFTTKCIITSVLTYPCVTSHILD